MIFYKNYFTILVGVKSTWKRQSEGILTIAFREDTIFNRNLFCAIPKFDSNIFKNAFCILCKSFTWIASHPASHPTRRTNKNRRSIDPEPIGILWGGCPRVFSMRDKHQHKGYTNILQLLKLKHWKQVYDLKLLYLSLFITTIVWGL